MAKSRRTRSSRSRSAGGAKYWTVSTRPLQILAFLLPLIIAYELALTFLLQSQENVRTVLAHSFLLKFFDAFHVAPRGGLHLGGIVIVVVLVVWHILVRERWRVEWRALGLMAVEAVALAIPFLILSRLISRPVAAGVLSATLSEPFDGLDVWSMIAISVGAGLYEELMFRMMLIAALHTLLVDLAKASQETGAAIAVAVSAAAFALYHPLDDGSGGLAIQKLAFYLLAGLFFGAVYVIRGFGIVVGVHALYDVAVALLGSTPGD